MGPVTRLLQQSYFDMITGRDASHAGWRTSVP
jgi:hypothetical protein